MIFLHIPTSTTGEYMNNKKTTYTLLPLIAMILAGFSSTVTAAPNVCSETVDGEKFTYLCDNVPAGKAVNISKTGGFPPNPDERFDIDVSLSSNIGSEADPIKGSKGVNMSAEGNTSTLKLTQKSGEVHTIKEPAIEVQSTVFELPPFMKDPNAPEPLIKASASFIQEKGTKIVAHDNRGRAALYVKGSGLGTAFIELSGDVENKGEGASVFADAGTAGRASVIQKASSTITSTDNLFANIVRINSKDAEFTQENGAKITAQGVGKKVWAIRAKSEIDGDATVNIHGTIEGEDHGVVIIENNALEVTQKIRNGGSVAQDQLGNTSVLFGSTAKVSLTSKKSEVKEAQMTYDKVYTQATHGFLLTQRVGILGDVMGDKETPEFSQAPDQALVLAPKSTTIIEKGADLTGAIGLSDGTDLLTIRSSKLDKIFFMDGGDDVDNKAHQTWLTKLEDRDPKYIALKQIKEIEAKKSNPILNPDTFVPNYKPEEDPEIIAIIQSSPFKNFRNLRSWRTSEAYHRDPMNTKFKPMADDWTDVLTFEGVTSKYSGWDMTRWEVVKLNKDANGNGTQFTLMDNLWTGSGTDTKGQKLGLHIDSDSSLITAGKGTDSDNEAMIVNRSDYGGTNNSKINYTESNKDYLESYENSNAIIGDVHNKGTIDLDRADNHKPSHTLVINGDYYGGTDTPAILKMNTVWNAPGDEAIEDGNDSESDVLHIRGREEGQTVVKVIGSHGENHMSGTIKPGISKIFNTRPVVIVDHAKDSTEYTKAHFTGTIQTEGATEIQLTYRDHNYDHGSGKVERREYYWTMDALPEPPKPEPKPEPEPKPKPIYNPVTTGIVGTPVINLEQGYTGLATLHTRQGDNLPMAWDSCGCVAKKAKGQTWGRIFGQHLHLVGKERFNVNLNNGYGAQIGHDFIIPSRSDLKERHHMGIFGTFNQGHAKFYDRLRTENGIVVEDKKTGNAHAQQFSLGVNYTYYGTYGTYVDLVGQGSYIRNMYSPRNEIASQQQGWGLGLSAEVGHPVEVGYPQKTDARWVLEPQAQLTYQYMELAAFSPKANTLVAKNSHHGLRSRLGLRVANYSKAGQYTNTFYAITNIYADLLGSNSVAIGTDTVSEKFNKVWGELGVGFNVPVHSKVHIYGETRGQYGFGQEKRKGFNLDLGLKYTW